MEQTVNVNQEVSIEYVKCSKCGAELDFNANADRYGYIQITVDKCDCSDD